MFLVTRIVIDNKKKVNLFPTSHTTNHVTSLPSIPFLLCYSPVVGKSFIQSIRSKCLNQIITSHRLEPDSK